MSIDGTGHYQCSTCREIVFTQSEAIGHTCGEKPPEPVLTDEPMTTRQAVMMLTNQLANIAEAIREGFASLNATNHPPMEDPR